MKSVVNGQWLMVGWLKISAFCVLTFVLCLVSCSVPNLENPVCKESRQAVREFYSFHFGGDMKPSEENLERHGRFLTDELKQILLNQPGGAKDYFTVTDDYPKAFRVGSCAVENKNKTVFQVVLFWRDDTRSQQKEIKVETIKENDKWLINKISDGSK